MKNHFIQYGVGIDVGKDDLHLHFVAKTDKEEFKIRGKKKFKNSPAGREDLVLWIEKHRKDKELPLRIYLEVTGVYHEEVLFLLESKGYWVSLLMGKRVKAYGKSIGQDSKNDLADSYVLARLAVSHKECRWRPVSAHILEIRALMRYRRSLIESRVADQNRIHALEHSLQPSALLVRALKEAIAQKNQQIAFIEEETLKLTQKDEELYKKITAITDSIKGLGLITMLEVISETNGFTMFRSLKQLIKYAGFDIIENQSGKLKGKTRISKNGNARLRAAMYMPAMALVRHEVKPFRALYMRVLKRNPGIKKKALVAVQRKLLTIIYTLWKNNSTFDPDYHTKRMSLKATSSQNGSSSETTPELHRIAQPKLASNA